MRRFKISCFRSVTEIYLEFGTSAFPKWAWRIVMGKFVYDEALSRIMKIMGTYHHTWLYMISYQGLLSMRAITVPLVSSFSISTLSAKHNDPSGWLAGWLVGTHHFNLLLKELRQQSDDSYISRLKWSVRISNRSILISLITTSVRISNRGCDDETKLCLPGHHFLRQYY